MVDDESGTSPRACVRSIRRSATTISPGVVESELAATITDPDTAAYLHEACKIALKPEAIAKAIRYAIEQPGEVVAPDGRGVLSFGLGPRG